MAIATVDLGFPPAIVLVTKDRKDIPLAEAQLLRDCGLVHV